jgi:hypothetical protein
MSPMAKTDWQMVHLRLSRELYEEIKRQAETEERPLARVIERALRERFLPTQRGRTK